MFKNNVGFLPNAVENLFTANATVHNYNTRNKHKLRAARGIHQYVYSTFRFVGIKVWNYITDQVESKLYKKRPYVWLLIALILLTQPHYL